MKKLNDFREKISNKIKILSNSKSSNSLNKNNLTEKSNENNYKNKQDNNLIHSRDSQCTFGEQDEVYNKNKYNIEDFDNQFENEIKSNNDNLKYLDSSSNSNLVEKISKMEEQIISLKHDKTILENQIENQEIKIFECDEKLFKFDSQLKNMNQILKFEQIFEELKKTEKKIKYVQATDKPNLKLSSNNLDLINVLVENQSENIFEKIKTELNNTEIKKSSKGDNEIKLFKIDKSPLQNEMEMYSKQISSNRLKSQKEDVKSQRNLELSPGPNLKLNKSNNQNVNKYLNSFSRQDKSSSNRKNKFDQSTIKHQSSQRSLNESIQNYLNFDKFKNIF